MKRLLVGALILNLSLGLFGCSSSKAIDNSSSESNISSETTENTKKRSSDEMYELYNSKTEEIKKLFKENDIDFKEEKDEDNKKYSGNISINYEDSDIEEVYKFPSAGYGIVFKDNDEISYIVAWLNMNVNDDEMKTKEFKFEDTEFYKLHNILIPDVKSAEEINKKVNEKYKELISIEVIEIESENITERIMLGDNSFVYTIIINP